MRRLGWLRPRRPAAADAARWIKDLGVGRRTPSRPSATLRGGNQQKVALGRLLHQQADVLLLDEPTRGVDVGGKAQIYRLIGELAAQGKASAHGQLVPARAARRLRPPRRDEPAAGCRRSADGGLDAESVLHAA